LITNKIWQLPGWGCLPGSQPTVGHFGSQRIVGDTHDEEGKTAGKYLQHKQHTGGAEWNRVGGGWVVHSQSVCLNVGVVQEAFRDTPPPQSNNLCTMVCEEHWCPSTCTEH
jgi:hypothetical protein